MSKIRIWHNPRCSKSRQGLEYLTERGCEVDIFEYSTDEIDAAELAHIIEMSDQPLVDFIRTGEPEYRELGVDEKTITVREFAEIAARHPKLLQRPIVIKDGKAIIARPTDRIDGIL